MGQTNITTDIDMNRDVLHSEAHHFFAQNFFEKMVILLQIWIFICIFAT